MKTRVTWTVTLLLVVALGVMVATAEAREDKAADVERPDGPAVEAVALEYQPVHAAMGTIEQLLDQDLFDDVRENLALAVNEPANAIVLVGPPEVVERLSGLLHDLDKMADQRREMDRERGKEQLEHLREMRERFGKDFDRMPRESGRCPGCRRGEAPREMGERENAERRDTRRREETEERKRMPRPRPRDETFRFRFDDPGETKTPQLRKMIDELRRQMDMLEEQRDRTRREMRRGRPSSFGGSTLHI